jgi:hypothetical protein
VLVSELCLSHWFYSNRDLRVEVQTPQSITCCSNSSNGKVLYITHHHHQHQIQSSTLLLSAPSIRSSHRSKLFISLQLNTTLPPTPSLKSPKMPPKRIQVQPSTRRAPPPSNYFTAAWQTITSEENSSVVISLTMAAVSSSLLSIPVINATVTRKRSCDQKRRIRGREQDKRGGATGKSRKKQRTRLT